MHRRSRDPPVGPCGRARTGGPSASRSTRPAIRRSAPAWPAGLSGPLRHRFGAPRDLVLGVTLVLADGTVVNAGGKVVKNVAGYDLGKLVCGSSRPPGGSSDASACAFIPPRPQRRTSSSAPAMLPWLVARLLASQLVPSALDVLHPGRVAILFEGGAGGRAGSGRGNTGTRRRRGRRTAAVWEESRSAPRPRPEDGCRLHPARLRSFLERVPVALVRPSAGERLRPGSGRGGRRRRLYACCRSGFAGASTPTGFA